MKEISAIEDLYPDAFIVLCRWHVSEAWNRHARSWKIDPGTFLTDAKAMMYAFTLYEFNQLKDTLMPQWPVAFRDYFAKNYLPIQKYWACYARVGVCFLREHTNNRLERLNLTVKMRINRRRLALGKLVSRLYDLYADRQGRAQVEKLKEETKQRSIFGQTLAAGFQLTTTYAVKKVMKEVSSSQDASRGYVVAPHDNDTTLVKSKCGTYVVDLEEQSCSCGFIKEMMLPCRHLYVAKGMNSDGELPYFDQATGRRWLLSDAEYDDLLEQDLSVMNETTQHQYQNFSLNESQVEHHYACRPR
jgi:hypothetical protein